MNPTKFLLDPIDEALDENAISSDDDGPKTYGTRVRLNLEHKNVIKLYHEKSCVLCAVSFTLNYEREAGEKSSNS